ncbi:MAG: hypothetical protein NZO58_08865, partial [Gemmataceae bacterium]|nr:hypothetical protein [Gemmataceae bacterium]
LGQLGAGYKFDPIGHKDLLDAEKLRDYDVLFLPCAPDDPNLDFAGTLRDFVTNGGTIYASDWRYDCIARAFKELASQRLNSPGRGQIVHAEVVEPGLKDLLGERVELKFDLDKWKPAAFAGDRVKVLIRGEYQRQDGGYATAPLLVKFQVGKGTVIFTSFHNEKQNSETELKLLKYIVFSAVTAQMENEVNQTLYKGGFSPKKQNLLSASRDNPRVTYKYHSSKAGPLTFVLAFEESGARLKLTVVGPQGKSFEREGTSTLKIDVPSAAPGEWRYTVEALEVPYENFPFTVTVAEGAK